MQNVRRIAVGTIGALAMSVTGLAGSASAQEADDLSIVVGNVPVAVSTLAAGVENALEAASTTQSLQQTVEALVKSDGAGGGGPVGHGTQAGVKPALVDLFWGISLESPANGHGSGVGYIVNLSTTGIVGATDGRDTVGMLLGVIDDPTPLLALGDDPTRVRCHDVPLTPTRSVPCEIISVEQLQALLDLAPAELAVLTDAEVECLARLVEGRIEHPCAVVEALVVLQRLGTKNGYAPLTHPMTPIFAITSNGATMSNIVGVLVPSLVPADAAAALDQVRASIAPLTGPLAEAIRGLDL